MNLKLSLNHDIFQIVSECSSQLAVHSYVVGGYVRDILLSRGQRNDIDIVTVGDGIALARKVSDRLPHKPKVHFFKTYGTAMINVNGTSIEFVGARKESYRRESRNPIVTSGSLEDDQNRRDFTINSLAVSLERKTFGLLIDPFNGVQDIKNQCIRTPLDPDVTFSDDPLRMLRAIRFANQLHFNIDKQAQDSIFKNRKRITIISKERIVEELNKILACKTPSVGFKLLHQCGLLELILPELTRLCGVEEREGCSHKDNFYHTLEVVDNICRSTENIWLRWAALLHDIGKFYSKRFDSKIGWTFYNHEYVGSKMVFTLFKRLKLPQNEALRYVQKMVLMSSRPIALVDDSITDSALRRILYDAGEDINDLLLLCEADITTKNATKKKQYLNNFKMVRQKLIEVEERDRIKNFQPPITGKIIMNHFDLRPSKEIGVIKDKIKDAILNGDIPNQYDAAFDYMIIVAKELGLSYNQKV